MNPCEYTVLISSIACNIAKGKSEDEIELLAALFTQLGDSLATYVTYKSVCCCKQEEEEDEFPIR